MHGRDGAGPGGDGGVCRLGVEGESEAEGEWGRKGDEVS